MHFSKPHIYSQKFILAHLLSKINFLKNFRKIGLQNLYLKLGLLLNSDPYVQLPKDISYKSQTPQI
jgi:hypothetical protein